MEGWHLCQHNSALWSQISPQIFNAVADTLEWILQQHGVCHYLDDYITAGAPGSDECHWNCQIITSMCELLGVPLASEKCEGPQTCLEYLGFELDTIKGEIRLPEEKLQRLKTLFQLRKGVDIYIGKTRDDICPVAAVLSFLAIRGQKPGPLFICCDSTQCTKGHFILKLRSALQAAGLVGPNFAGHSFCIRA